MNQPTILCPIDFSDCSRRALKYASALAEHFGARLIILHATDPLLAAAVLTYESYLVGGRAKHEVEAFAEPAVSGTLFGKERLEVALTIGEAPAEIIRIADERGVDLIVMGTHGLSSYQKPFGSTTERVLRRTQVPVLAVSVSDDLAAAPGTLLIDTGPVLAPVDFSEPSERAAGIAAAVALSLDRPVVLLHVVTPIPTLLGLPERATVQDKACVDIAVTHLETLAATITPGTRREIAVVTGRPAEEIAHAAAERRVSLIVMALRSAGGPLSGHGPGAVAYRVLSLAPAPVLAIPLVHKPERPHLENILQNYVVGMP